MTSFSEPEWTRSEARRQAILEVARQIFFDRGYAAASMSEIAARLGGSKGTLYNYFRSKEELFAAFMTDTCQGPANDTYDHLPPLDADIREGLIEFGVAFLEFVLREETMALHRLVIAECGRFPELGRLFYELGPQRGELRLSEYFRQAMSAGRIRQDDPLMVARRFKDLVASDIYLRRLWGVIDHPSPEAIRAHVTEAVDIFLQTFGQASDPGDGVVTG